MQAQNPINAIVDIPADGVYSAPINIGGYTLIVVDAPDIVDMSQAATLHLENQTGDGVPMISRTVVSYPPGFSRWYIQGHGESAGVTLRILIIPTVDLRVSIPIR